MNVLLTVFAPAIAFAKANALALFLRWMPYIFFAFTTGVGLIFDSPAAKLGLVLIVVSTITLVLDVEGKLPDLKLPASAPKTTP